MYSKRKRHTDHPREPNYDPRRVQEDYERTQADHARALAKFQLQAYEADVVTGPVAKGRARMLEYVEGVGPGKGLIACAPGDEEGSGSGAQSDAGWGGFDGGEDVISLGSSAVTSKSSTAPNRVTGESGVGKTVWVDR
ncbi:hypothetical protein CC2G_004732 [Coprinopsis cinerea AmutBmut pab1-1]|nr:hypothetical protein CC2G_004732 [Coprinopsis cinerea AmutBmut pab1-1]